MTTTDDFTWMWLNREGDAAQAAAALAPVLARLEGSFLPQPATLEVPGRRDTSVAGWRDAKLAKAIEQRKDGIGLKGPGVSASIGQGSRLSVSLFFRIGPEPAAIRSLFADLCGAFAPTYGRVSLHNKGQELHDRHYAAHRRTFYASGLFWLNFFGPDEEARQGGAALADNPHARATRTPQGLLLEVGDGPLDALAPEGEARLLAATRAMPPLPSEPADAPFASPEATSEAPREPAPIITVGGVRGWLDPGDQGFWVSKHVEPARALDAKTIRTLGALPGKGTPPIKLVNVLFSTEEAARASAAPLSGAGVRTWYVSLEDGKPRAV